MKKRLTRLMLLFLVITLTTALLPPLRAEAATLVTSGTYGADKATWELYDNGQLTISGGEMTEDKVLEEYADQVTSLNIDGVSTISSDAFAGFRNLTNVYMRNVSGIESGAFRNCTNLNQVRFVTSSMSYIGASAFAGCTSLKTLVLPTSLTTLDSSVFAGCTGLETIVIPQNVTNMGDDMFKGCTGLKYVTILGKVQSLGMTMFQNLPSLERVLLPSSVTEIGTAAFDGTTATVYYPQQSATANMAGNNFNGNLTWVEALASGSCGDTVSWAVSAGGNLRIFGTGAMRSRSPGDNPPWHGFPVVHAVVDEGVTYVGNYAFVVSQQDVLETVDLASTVTSIGFAAFRNSTKLKTVTVRGMLTEIEDYAFEGCTALTTVNLLKGVEDIGSYAFKLCSNLKQLNLPEGLKYIRDYAFNQSGITSLTIPASTLRIFDSAFYYAKSLKTVKFLGDMPDAIGALYDVTATCYYPFGNPTFNDLYTNNGKLTWVAVYEGPYSGLCGDNLRWTLVEDGTLTISGTGAMWDYTAETPAPWYGYRGAVKQVVIQDGVTSIGAYAFNSCSKLTDVSVPGSVASVGEAAFIYTGLKQITFAGGAPAIGGTAFTGISATAYYPGSNDTWTEDVRQNYGGTLTWVALKAPATAKIGDQEYETLAEAYKAAKLGDIIVLLRTPDETDVVKFSKPALIRMNEGVTYSIQCDEDWETSWDSDVNATRVGSNPYWNISTDEGTIRGDFGNGVLYLQGKGAMPDVQWGYGSRFGRIIDQIEEVQVGEGITKLGRYDLQNAVNLKKVTLPESLKIIGENAFNGCVSLTEIDLPGVEEVLDHAFANCTGLVRVSMPSMVKLARGAFSTTGLTSVTLPATLTSVTTDRFTSDNYQYNSFYNCTSLTEILVEEGNGVYAGINGLLCSADGTALIMVPSGAKGTLVVPEGITSVADYAAYERSDITGLELPDTLTTIGEYAFYGMGITSLEIPDSVTRINRSAFSFNENLSEAVIGAGLTELPRDLFWYCTNLTYLEIPETVQKINSYFVYNGATVKFLGGPVEFVNFPNYNSFNYKCLYPAYDTRWKAEHMYDASRLSDWTPYGENVVDGGYHQSGEAILWLVTQENGEYILTFRDTGIIPQIYSGWWYDYKDQITKLVISDDVSGVGREAFREWDALKEVVIGSGVKLLDEYAFARCDGLTEITIPGTLQEVSYGAFSRCSNLATINIEQGVEVIGRYAFSNNQSLEQITVPASVQTLDEYAFVNCTALQSVELNAVNIGHSVLESCQNVTSLTLGDTVESIGNNAFAGTAITEVSVPDSVTTMGTQVFYNCSQLVKAKLPAGLTEIPDGTFAYCTSLTNADLILPDRYSRIGAQAFYVCSNLNRVPTLTGVTEIGEEAFGYTGITRVTVPNTVTSLGAGVFVNCSALIEATLGTGITEIPDRMFSSCSDLVRVTMKGQVTAVGNSSFSACYDYEITEFPQSLVTIGENAYFCCKLPQGLVLPNSVTTIGDDAFNNCTIVGTAVIPDSVTNLGKMVFRGVNQMEKLVIGSGVTTISERLAWGSYHLREVVLGENVTSISLSAFDGCTSLTTVTLNDKLTKIGEKAFYQCEVLEKITIPAKVTRIEFAAFEGTALNEITFAGNAPLINEEAFYGVEAVAYYPLGNNTWNEDTMWDYGGTLTWVGKQMAPVMTGSIRIRSATLDLLDKVRIIYRCSDDTIATNNAQVLERGVLLFATEELAKTKDPSKAYETIVLEWEAESGRYKGSSEGIDARDMDKSQFAVAYVKMIDGSYIFSTKDGAEQMVEYSPLIYCKKYMDDDTTVGKLCRAMMHYGAAAQVAQYGMTTGLMNEGFAAISYDASVLGETVFSADTAETNGLQLRSGSMDLKGAISYIVKFSVEDTDLNGKQLYAEYNLLGETGSVEMELDSDGRYRATIDGIAAKDMGATLKIKAYWVDENGERMYSGELVYSGYEYVRRALPNTSLTTSVKDLAKALAMYIHYADIYGNG